MSEFTSQNYTFLFMKEFANIVFLKSAKRYLGVHWGTLWKRKYPQMKIRKKVSEKLFSDVWIRLTELHFPFMEQFPNSIFGVTVKDIFEHFEAYSDKLNALIL